MRSICVFVSCFFITFLTVSVYALNMQEVTVEAFATSEEMLDQQIRYLALKEYTSKYVTNISPIQQDLAIRYFLTYRPMAYVKDIVWIRKEKEGLQWVGKATVLLSTGETFTGFNEFIDDIGNPLVYIECHPTISVKNLSDPTLIRQVEMELPLETVFSPKFYQKVREIGLEITSNKEKTDIRIELSPVADVYYDDGFNLTLSAQTRIIDTLTDKIFSQAGYMMEPYFFRANPSFFLQEMSTRIVDELYKQFYSDVVNFLLSQYDREKTLNLIDFSQQEIEEAQKLIREQLPLVTEMKEKAVTLEPGFRKNQYNLYYFGSMNMLLRVLETRYMIRSIRANEITIETLSYILVFTNCDTENLKKIRDYFKKIGTSYSLQAYQGKELILAVKGIEDAFALALQISDELPFELLSIENNRILFEYKSF